MREDKVHNRPRGVVETVRFRLAAGVLPADFVDMAQAGAGVLTALPGFRRRLLCEDNGHWQDVIEWDSLANAQAALPVIMAHPAFAEFMAAMDPASIEMCHGTLHLTIGA